MKIRFWCVEHNCVANPFGVPINATKLPGFRANLPFSVSGDGSWQLDPSGLVCTCAKVFQKELHNYIVEYLGSDGYWASMQVVLDRRWIG